MKSALKSIGTVANRVAIGALLSSTALAPSLAQPSAGPLQLEPCELPGFSKPANCGTYTVLADREDPDGPRIPLRVVVVPATGGSSASDALIYFAGGPGGSSVDAAGFVVSSFSELHQTRDILLIDFRGTGESDPLNCPYQEEPKGREEVLETFLPSERIADCREALADGRNLDAYTTVDIVDDIDEVRAALGYQQLNLFGASYGTRVAQVYLRRHPESVRTVILEGAVPNNSFLPLTLARDAQVAFDQLVAECGSEPACNEAFPHPSRDLSLVLGRLSEQPVEVEVVDPQSGETKTLHLSVNVARQTIRYMLYSSIKALQLPLYLRAAAEGNFEPLAQNAYTVAGGLLSGMPDGLYLAVTCAEDVQFVDRARGEAFSNNTFLGNFRLHQQLAACAAWGGKTVDPSFHQPVRSGRPVLIISGERDPVTPASWGRRVEFYLSNVRHLVVPDGAHGFWGLKNTDCLETLMINFVRAGSLDDLDIEGCEQAIERPPFTLELAKQEAVTLAEAELAKIAGTYIAEGFSFSVELLDGKLWMTFDERTQLIPLSPTRFRQPGSSPGDYFEFVLEDGHAVQVEMIAAGTQLLTLERRQAAAQADD